MQNTNKPWYKHTAAWLLFLGPIVVVFAGLYTAWIAVNIDDGMVIDDYYKEGKAINQVLTRDKNAAQAQLKGTLWLGQNQKTLRLALTHAPEFQPGKTLTLRLQHPTKSSADIVLNLKEIAPDTYETSAEETLQGRWYVSVEEADWRLTSEWQIKADVGLLLGKP